MAKKVLVVDDEKLIVKGIRFSLLQDGMEVDCAYDGEEALNMAKVLYLTHVAIRALMNVIGIKTFYFQNYVFCILISLFLTYTIVKLQKKLI